MYIIYIYISRCNSQSGVCPDSASSSSIHLLLSGGRLREEEVASASPLLFHVIPALHDYF